MRIVVEVSLTVDDQGRREHRVEVETGEREMATTETLTAMVRELFRATAGVKA